MSDLKKEAEALHDKACWDGLTDEESERALAIMAIAARRSYAKGIGVAVAFLCVGLAVVIASPALWLWDCFTEERRR